MELSTGNILSIIFFIIGFLGLNTICAYYWKKYFKKHEDNNEKIKLQEKQERKEEIKEVMQEQLAPIQESLNDLKSDNILNKKGLQAVLRDRLYSLYKFATEERCKGNIEKAYSTTEEKQNFENMYQNYHSLGVNGVMDTKYEHFMNLPDYEPSTPKKTRKTSK